MIEAKGKRRYRIDLATDAGIVQHVIRAATEVEAVARAMAAHSKHGARLIRAVCLDDQARGVA